MWHTGEVVCLHAVLWIQTPVSAGNKWLHTLHTTPPWVGDNRISLFHFFKLFIKKTSAKIVEIILVIFVNIIVGLDKLCYSDLTQ